MIDLHAISELTALPVVCFCMVYLFTRFLPRERDEFARMLRYQAEAFHREQHEQRAIFTRTIATILDKKANIFLVDGSGNDGMAN